MELSWAQNLIHIGGQSKQFEESARLAPLPVGFRFWFWFWFVSRAADCARQSRLDIEAVLGPRREQDASEHSKRKSSPRLTLRE